MIFKSFKEFETFIDDLFNQEKYDEASNYMENQLNLICSLSSLGDIQSYLFFYASIAGDYESVDRFERLFQKLVDVKKVSIDELSKYKEIFPANRWL